MYFQMRNILRQLGLPNCAEVERKFEEEKVYPNILNVPRRHLDEVLIKRSPIVPTPRLDS